MLGTIARTCIAIVGQRTVSFCGLNIAAIVDIVINSYVFGATMYLLFTFDHPSSHKTKYFPSKMAHSSTLLLTCMHFDEELKNDADWKPSNSIRKTVPGECFSSRNGGFPSANTRTNNALALSYSTVEYLGRGEMDKYRADMKVSWEREVPLLKVQPVEEWEVWELARVLCSIFFLEPFYALDVDWERLGSSEKGLLLGHTEHLEDRETGTVTIRVDPTDTHAMQTQDSHLASTVSTLMHELIHGYLIAFCCDGAGQHDRNGNCCRDGVAVLTHSHDIAWFLLACQIDLCFEEMLGFKGHMGSFQALISDDMVGMRLSAGDWKLFFSSFKWADIRTILDHLAEPQQGALMRMLKKDKDVMQVWAEEGAWRGEYENEDQ